MGLSSKSDVSPKTPSVSPAAAAAATRKYYTGRKGPMLGEHTSLTFTRKYFHRPSSVVIYITHLFLLSTNIFFSKRKLPGQHAAGAKPNGGGGCRFLAPSSAAASVKMALTNAWKTARRNGSGR